ncbi:MAG: 23S rRNA (adenine(2503)-C(2))-methyltransferase RlmN [Candidatus Omnitrophica bacterium]|nr:23S rRNA (adenine(2503)-C(2))-methyltransferase RlmN [Candidatus Omnitrophota bacterium]
MNKKIIMSGLIPEELKKLIGQYEMPAYRSSQLLDWVYKKGVLSFSGMSNVGKELRSFFCEKMQVLSLYEDKKLISRDNTAKYAFKTIDNEIIESVFIPADDRATICVSTQAGCAFGCVFCASAKSGLKRNLTADEIVSQVLLIKNDNPKKRVTNIVVMGMGEPFANYENTLKAVRIFNDPDCLGIAARKITISTCGLPEGISKFAKEGIQAELSISLHAGTDELRSRIMPVNKKHPLSELMKAAKDYINATNRIITFEYALIKGVNDRQEDADALANLLSKVKCKVNFITLNELAEREFLTSSPREIEAFKEVLDKRNVNYTFRKKRGADIQAACGQLRLNSD